MKHIEKQAEPQLFSEWKAMANEEWQPTYSALGGELKKAVKQALMVEQGFICCYCERRLSDNDSHIEHFRPQSDPSVDPLDYSNMLCSCQNRLKKGEPRHCGNLKDKWFDEKLLVSPLDSTCEEQFAFLGDGSIKSTFEQDQAASETIRKLGLNCSKLKALRKSAIDVFLDEKLSTEEVKMLVMAHLAKDSAGKYGEFWSAIRYLFGGLLAA